MRPGRSLTSPPRTNSSAEKHFPLAGRNKMITKLNDGDNQESSQCWSEE
jgi:hypothetical protein